MKWPRSIFCSAMTAKTMPRMAGSSHGTHQLALRLRSVNVFLGAMNVLINRCGSERPGPAGSGAMVGAAGGKEPGGGGVWLVGKFIFHPTFEIEQKLHLGFRT